MNLKTISGLRVSLASPEQMLRWSHGEVTTPDTINYLTNQPEKGGLFCERIFGPVQDWSCACKNYHFRRFKGVRCKKCGVIVTSSKVRRERMGHIALVIPVVHSWFAQGTPSVLALLLGLTQRQLMTVISYTGYLVTQVHEARRRTIIKHTPQDSALDPAQRELLATLRVGTFLDEDSYDALMQCGEHVFCAQTGGEALATILSRIKLDELAATLRRHIHQEGLRPLQLKRLHVVEAFRRSGVHPSWMVLRVLPVLPPDLRPIVRLDNGHLASSDLNTLYASVIHRNARVRHMLDAGAPGIIIRHEKRLLQDACDALLDNLHRKTPWPGPKGQPLKSLTHVVQGKRGRFRHNLLGKRVDYSGRSVITVGLDLDLHECGLPKRIAIELFQPFVVRKLLDRLLARSPRHAKRTVERRDPVVWDLLAECMHEKVVLLNRAPTLHRLSIQAFEAKLVEGETIRLHPLVCSAFNADFDGDQMAVHLPLSEAAQAEARSHLLSIRNLRSPAAGEPSISLSQDIVLGCFYLTEDRPSEKRAGRRFADATEAHLAYEQGLIDLHTPIIVRLPDQHLYNNPPPTPPDPAPPRGRVQTTVGRLLFNALLPDALRYRNYALTKEGLKQLVAESLATCGDTVTAHLADAIKRTGYAYATKSGLSFAMSDIVMPPQREGLIAQGQARAREVDARYQAGEVTREEWSRQMITIWTEVTEQISGTLKEVLDTHGTIMTIVKSGATKAKFQQIRQLSGIRGLLTSPTGTIMPVPVLSNYLLGLRGWEVFIAASGARKGFMDRSLNTAMSGYLTRKLVEVGMEVWTTLDDCQTSDGILITTQESQALGLPDMRSRILGRVLAEAAAPWEAGTLLDEATVTTLLGAGVQAIRVRSPLTCRATYGLCCRCYGADLSTGRLVQRGVAVGVIAGQSVGEPGTQLTMRTFHSGGIANAQGDITLGLPRVSALFEAHTPKQAGLLADRTGVVQIVQHRDAPSTLRIISSQAPRSGVAEEPTWTIPSGQKLLVEQCAQVEAGMLLTDGPYDPKRILQLSGNEAAARYLVNEVQRVYRATGVYLHDKHLEVIVRQMLRYVQILDEGETDLLPGALVDRFTCEAASLAALAQGGAPALASPVLLGLTKAALSTSSWVAAASFQETSRILTQAAIRGQIDPLRGFKERIVVGARIPTNGEI